MYRNASVYVEPAKTAQAFADQLESELMIILDDLAPTCTSTKRQQKPESRWLSAEAVVAMQNR